MLFKRILFPTDFSKCSEQAFDYAILLSRQFNAQLHILNAIVIYNGADYFQSVQGLEQIYDQLKDIATTQMAKLIETHKVNNLSIEQMIIPAFSASQMILDYLSDTDIDLIVMGTHGRRGLS